jgi:hypothetical protein
MVAVPKQDGKMRLCLDPWELNMAIRREHYQLPTIEEIATRLMDARNGFWHIRLDEASSFLTTFNTPFGRYRLKRMPFGIKSAPEVFQRWMHEVVEGLKGVEVVADDIVVVGFGETIEEMPPPEDVAAVQCLLGLAQCLSKFLPHLSDITKPLRDLTKQEIEWTWGPPQQDALDKLKKAVSSTPVLRYYNLQEEGTLQCDASQSGLGAALLQNGQPVAYASRALTSPKTRYAQIEKQ